MEDTVRYEVRAEDDYGNPQILYRDDLAVADKLADRALVNDAAYVSIFDNQTGKIVWECDAR